MPELKCGICGSDKVVIVCLSCRGRAGGKSKSPAKVRASRKQAKAALAARMRKLGRRAP
jgi:hypothetical protein